LIITVVLSTNIALSANGQTSDVKILGDVDADGVVDILDSTFLQRHLTNIPIPFEIETGVADVDCGGELTMLDATMICRYLIRVSSCGGIGKPLSDSPTEQPSPVTYATAVRSADGELTDIVGRGIYGFSFTDSDPASLDVRICDASEFTNDYMIVDSFVRDGHNDFDNVYPWAGIRRCCINGTDIIYEGEDGFKTDGSAGDVFVEIPAFYSCIERIDDSTRIAVSSEPQPGFVLEPAFYDSTGAQLPCIYVAAYATTDYNRSVSGAMPTVAAHTKTFISRAALKSYSVYDLAVWSALQKLITVEFGTRDISGHMYGIGELIYNKECVAIKSENNTNAITVSTSSSARSYKANYLREGMVIVIDENPVKNNKTSVHRIITGVSDHNDGTITFTFDGPPTDVVRDKTYLSNIGQPSGNSDSIPYHTGRGDHNTTTAFKYRGLENLWGNVWTQTAGIAVKNLRYYVTTDISKYEQPVEEWIRLDIEAPEQIKYTYVDDGGWIQSFGVSESCPWLLLPNAVCDDVSVVGDKFYCIDEYNADGVAQSPDNVYKCVTGGGWDNLYGNGPFTLRFWGTSTYSWLYGSRLVIRDTVG
jgi:hypothetical protein